MGNMLKTDSAPAMTAARATSNNTRASIIDIMDVYRMRQVIKQFAKMTGMAVGLIDHETQEVLLQTGWSEICTKFHRADARACQRCKESDQRLTKQLGHDCRISVEQCTFGLVDGATAIFLNDAYVADLCVGQVLFAPPDLDLFRRRAREYGFHEEDYIAAAGKLQVIDEQQFHRVLQYLKELSEMIGEMGLNHLRLQETETHYRQLMEATQEPIVVVSDQRYVFVNPAMCRMLGYAKPEDLLGNERNQHVAPEFRKLLTENHRRRIAGEDVESGYEFCMLHRDGHRIWVEVNARLVDFGSRKAVQASLHDITERKLAEQERLDLYEELNAVNEELVTTNDLLNSTNEELITTNEELADTIADLNKTNEELNQTYEELNSTYEELHSTYEELALSDEAVRSREEYFRALIENAADGIAIINERAELTYQSQADGHILGYKDGDLLNVSVFEKCHPDDMPIMAAEFEKLREDPGGIRRVTLRFKHHNGSWRVLDATLHNLIDHPLIQGVVVNYRDITARTQAELSLHRSREQYRELVENMDEGLVAVDPQEQFTFANPAAGRLFGMPAADLIGRNWSEFTSAETYARIVSATQQRQTGTSGEYEITLTRNDGESRTVLVIASPLPEADGSVAGTFGLLRDITKQKIAEIALQRSEEQFRALVENSPDIIVRYDKSLRIVYVNPIIEDITGERPEEMIGKTYRDLGYPKQRCDHWEQKISQVFENGQPLRLEVNPGNVHKVFDWRLSPEFGADGSVDSVLGILTDITERKKLTDRLIREQKDESMLTLAGGIAHDFNNILIGVLGSATMLHETFTEENCRLKDEEFQAEGIELCTTVITASQRMADLTNKLLAYARGGSFQPHAVDLAGTITDSLAIVRGRIPSNVEVKLRLENELWPVEADPGQLHQVWLNLIINAEEAMPAGGSLEISAINIEYEAEWRCPLDHLHPAGRYVSIEVTDSGEGMDKETIGRIFEPFYSTKFQGRGLGLAAVIGIVTTHGGCVYATSSVGQGSCFRVWLPCSDKQVIKERAVTLAAARPGETVLIVDDEEIVRVTARRMLQRRGFTVLTAKNATDGLGIFQNRQSDISLVMFDMHMPRVSGVEFYESLRRLDNDVKAIAISGYNETVALREMDTSRLAAFIQKPFAFKALIARVREVLDAKPLPDK